jgi:outer membrane protein OmpA-like peptidoglycan-associated protein
MGRRFFAKSAKALFVVVGFLGWLCHDGWTAVMPIAKFRSFDPSSGAPAGWTLETKTGKPNLSLEKEGEAYYLRMISRGDSSFGVRKAARVNVKEYPILTWRWKVEKMPVGGDVRKPSTDDQALQVYVAFKETSFPAALHTPVIGYIWDNEAPKGWMGPSSQIGGGKMRYIVLRNKTDRLGQWYTERRNIYEDYKRFFADINHGEPLGETTGLQLHINSQHTRTYAEGLIGDISFSSEVNDIAVTEAAKEKMSARTPVLSAPRTKTSFQAAPPRTGDVDFGKPGCLNLTIEFGVNSAQITEVPPGKIQTLMEYLAKQPGATLVLTGHSDRSGSRVHNIELSRRRAESVKKILVERYNIEASRLLVKAAGASQPIADDTTPEGQAQNRRVTIQHCPP